eukprot:CAMPEP_0174376618 /NCGR_PEP_ID=MMETSP0811_2-20130205/118766_1 /TAXON_ID=73025 ORGANISM="Eutreptiella gymnastica-like, Strain CCMP1594" /NCGR_SAMPLE_ID=MMETSP0811_2 /ASSEMBLY_ACC=CAM_ASM_000667 /LENGTH=114 /DNA_ID=CAMNT_0015527941 /DNA_START=26 /DNA_END=366 /DNA_ORIENTATION=+
MSAAAHPVTAMATTSGEPHELLTADRGWLTGHTFCGIMFDLEVLSADTTKIPIHSLKITSVSVKGTLGPMGVYSTPDSYEGKHQRAEQWTQHYEEEHGPSRDALQELQFDEDKP